MAATLSTTVGTRETESNDTISTADNVSSGTEITGQASSISDDDYYKISLSNAGTISVTFNDGNGSAYSDHEISIIDASGNVLAKESIYETGAVTAEVEQAGNYYILVDNSYDTEDYSLAATHSATTGVRETEANNTIETADLILPGTALKGQTSSISDIDFFKVQMENAATVRVTFESNGTDYSGHTITLFNSAGNEITSSKINGNTTTDLEFEAGTTIYGSISGSYDSEDYLVQYDII